MKMEKFIISAILIFALTNYAYGLGSTSSSCQIVGGKWGYRSRISILPTNGDSVPVSVPEPTTMLLLASGLIGLGAYVRRKFKK